MAITQDEPCGIAQNHNPDFVYYRVPGAVINEHYRNQKIADDN